MEERARILTHKYTTALFLLCCALAFVSTERQITWAEAAHPLRSVPTPRSVGGGIETERIWDRKPFSGTSDAQPTKQEEVDSVEIGLRSLFYTPHRSKSRNRHAVQFPTKSKYVREGREQREKNVNVRYSLYH